MPEEPPGDPNAGHRERLRDRLVAGGPDALLDHEIVELLLTLTLPRVDTKPLAKALLAEFGSVAGLFAADFASIGRVKGMGRRSAAAFKIVEAAALRLLRDRVMERPVLASWQALLDYLRADMAHRLNERVRVLHLDSRNRLVRDECMAEGSVDQASIHPREVIRRAIDLGSAAIILVHNHPSGDPQPSRADIELTRDIADAGRKLGLAVHDHIIIGASGHSSMRALGLL